MERDGTLLVSCELDIDNCREKFIDIILFADLNYVCIAASFVHDVSGGFDFKWDS